MSSKVETSLAVLEILRDCSTALGMTQRIFASLNVYRDSDSRSAALNMGIDEALLETAGTPSIRFYKWDHPALSFGYFGKFSDVMSYSAERDLVRRWTGGGIVLHGDDLTYSIVLPATDRAFSESSTSIYETIHKALRAALAANGQSAELAMNGAPKISESCFANPVRADVFLNGNKIAGAAQRRTRRGLLQQGSIQNVTICNDFPERFANELGDVIKHIDLDAALRARAADIAEQKYATRAWLERR